MGWPSGKVSFGGFRTLFGLPLLLAVLFALLPGSADAGLLDKTDQEALQEAEAQGQSRVTLLIAAKSDQYQRVAAQIRSLGGTVAATEGRIDYVKARVPLDAVTAVAKLKSVKAVDLDRLIPLDDPRVQGNSPAQPQSPPNSSTPRANPYMPIMDIGSAEFGETPVQDGRGTKVAVLDTGIDLGHPALATTSSSQPKVIDWFDAIPPSPDMGSWVKTEGRFTGAFTTAGENWIAPSSGGPFAFGQLHEDAGDLGTGLINGDLDRNGIKGEVFGVLQDRTTKEVYVDTNKNRDFTDDYGPMLDYRLNRDRSFFGTDDPGTAVREQMAFSVGTSRSVYPEDSDAGSWVNIGVTGGDHGTHVAGIIGATKMFGGAMSGAAPGAQLISVKVCPTSGGCSSAALVDGMVYAAEHGADVTNLSVGGLIALNDGDNARAELYNRLIDEYGMQIFISAGNSGAGVNTVGDPAVASDSVAVAASVTKESWLSNYGQVNATDNALFTFSSRGPSEKGGMKPDLTASGSAVSTTFEWAPGASVDGIYTLPPGYSMFNGTSMSSPQAAGAAAQLVGAYRHEFSQSPSPEDLRNALTSTADFLPDTEALGQGAGLINIDAAWQQLRQTGPVDRSKINATVQVNSVLSPQLKVPGQGVGIYEREGLQTGDDLTRTYTLTRKTGPAGTREFEVKWIGNDGTFSSATTVSLPLDSPVSFPVRIQPTTRGIHSALLQIDDPDSIGVDLTTQNVAFATTPSQGSEVTQSGMVGRGAAKSVLVNVPSGTTVLRVDMDAGGAETEKGQVRFRMVHPEGTLPEEMTSPQCFNPANPAGCPIGSPLSRSIVAPAPGVWEILVEGFRGSSAQNAPFTIKASLLNTVISPDPDRIRAQTYAPVTRNYEAKNNGSSFTGKLVGGPLRAVSSERMSLAHDQAIQNTFAVPSGTESLDVKIGNPSATRADLDLFLYDCTTGSCVLAEEATNSGAEESIQVENPDAGNWRVEIHAFEVPDEGTTDFDYMDSLTNAGQYGNLTVDDTEALRPPGTQWSADAMFSPAASLDLDGRKLAGQVKVVTDGGITVARSEVDFTIDTTPPVVTITKGPDPVGTDRSPRFEFTSDESGTTFECRLDGSAWVACVSGYSATDLEDGENGEHLFEVKATDLAGNSSTAQRDFILTAPTNLTATSVKGTRQGSTLDLVASTKLTHARTGVAVPDRSVEFKVGGVSVCTASTDSSGVAACSANVPAKSLSNNRYLVAFAGEPKFAAVQSEGQADIPPDPDPVCPAIKLGFKLSRLNAQPPARGVRRVPGIQARIRVGRPLIAQIKPRLRYRVSGRVKVVKLHARTLKLRGTSRLSFAVPARMTRDHRRAGKRLIGSPATLIIKARVREQNGPAGCAQSASSSLRTKVVKVSGKTALRLKGIW